MLNSYGDPTTDAAVLAERALLAELHGGCSVPVGAYAVPSGDRLKLTAQVTSLDATQRVFSSATGADAQLLGETLARAMLEQGAEAILRQIRVTVSRRLRAMSAASPPLRLTNSTHQSA